MNTATRFCRIAITLFLVVSFVFGCSGQPDKGQKSEGDQSTTASTADKQRSGGSSLGDSDAALNTQFIPQSATAAIVTDVRRIRTAPKFELIPWEILQAAGLEQFGVDPLQIEQVIAFAEPPTLGIPSFGVIVRFATDQTIPATLVERFPVLVAQPEPTIALLAMDQNMLDKMSAAQDAKSPLIELMQSKNPATAVSAFLAFAPVREMAKQLVGTVDLPPDMKKYTALVNHLSTVAIHVHLDSTAKIVVKGNDAAATGEIEKLLLDALSTGKRMFLAQASQSFDSGGSPVMVEASRKYMARLADSFETMLKPVRDEDRLTITVNATMPAAMVALLLPAVSGAREAARKMSSTNNLKQLGLGLHTYHDIHNKLPTNIYKDGKPLLSWRVRLLPYLEAEALYDEFHLDEPWDSEHNKKLIDRMPEAFANPNLPLTDRTVYLAITGKGTLFPGEKAMTFRDVSDGLSAALAVVEADPDRAVTWTKPDDLPYDEKNPGNGFGNFRPGGWLGLFADGAVEFIEGKPNPETLRRLMQISDGKPVELPNR